MPPQCRRRWGEEQNMDFKPGLKFRHPYRLWRNSKYNATKGRTFLCLVLASEPLTAIEINQLTGVSLSYLRHRLPTWLRQGYVLGVVNKDDLRQMKYRLLAPGQHLLEMIPPNIISQWTEEYGERTGSHHTRWQALTTSTKASHVRGPAFVWWQEDEACWLLWQPSVDFDNDREVPGPPEGATIVQSKEEAWSSDW